MANSFVEPSWIRAEIVSRILERFQAALPLYRDMMAVAHQINTSAGADVAAKLGKVMHAAIRCASGDELKTIRDIFALMGNQPVNYYDLREKVSVQSTAFRPTTADEIKSNGFRVFCSMLSLDCIPAEHRDFVQSIIDRRHLFDNELSSLIADGKSQGGFKPDQADTFVGKCVDLFTRPEQALVSVAEYEQLREINKVAAQVLISNSLAFNHLTPSVASVPQAHAEMLGRGIKSIPVWQGPVGRDVILRQTSCLAPPVTLQFPNGDGTFTPKSYQETFVEFEERLQALTLTGRLKFEELFANGKQRLNMTEADEGYPEHYYQTMRDALSEFPDSLTQLWSEGLAYFEYNVVDPTAAVDTLEQAVDTGAVELVPQTYEDFFGPAATNIFNSNIGLEDVTHVGIAKPDSKATFEQSLGCEVIDMYSYYDQIQHDSWIDAQRQLGI